MSVFKLDNDIFQLGSYTVKQLGDDVRVTNPELYQADIDRLKEYIDDEINGVTFHALHTSRMIVRMEACKGVEDFGYASFAEVISRDGDEPYVWKEQGAIGVLWCQIGKTPGVGEPQVVGVEVTAKEHFYSNRCRSRREVRDRIRNILSRRTSLSHQVEKLTSSKALSVAGIPDFWREEEKSPCGRLDVLKLNSELKLNLTDEEIEQIFS